LDLLDNNTPLWIVIYTSNYNKKIMDDINLIKGTARWYSPSKGRPGKFSLKGGIASEMSFKNTEEVVVELNKVTGTVCIKRL